MKLSRGLRSTPGFRFWVTGGYVDAEQLPPERLLVLFGELAEALDEDVLLDDLDRLLQVLGLLVVLAPLVLDHFVDVDVVLLAGLLAHRLDEAEHALLALTRGHLLLRFDDRLLARVLVVDVFDGLVESQELELVGAEVLVLSQTEQLVDLHADVGRVCVFEVDHAFYFEAQLVGHDELDHYEYHYHDFEHVRAAADYDHADIVDVGH